MIPNERLHDMTFEELFEYYGKLRFGSSMLPNRTLHAFNYFVQQGIFEEMTPENTFLSAYRAYSTEKDISEFERLRRWFIIFMLFEFGKEIEEEYP